MVMHYIISSKNQFRNAYNQLMLQSKIERREITSSQVIGLWPTRNKKSLCARERAQKTVLGDNLLPCLPGVSSELPFLDTFLHDCCRTIIRSLL